MAWIILIVSGVLESVWAAALTRSEGFSKPGPSIVFVVALIASMAGLGLALRSIPLGTGYAIWVGIGVLGTVIYGLVALDEPLSVARIVCLVAIVGGIVGLKLTTPDH